MALLPALKAWQHADLNPVFGWGFHDERSDNRSHSGLDIEMYVGKPVLALTDGTVRFAGNTGVFMGYGEYGHVLEVQVKNEGKWYYIAHLGSFAKGIHAGAEISRGQVIGYSSAHWPHIMITRRRRAKSTVIDPMEHIEKRTEDEIRRIRNNVQRIRKRETGSYYTTKRRDFIVRRIINTRYDIERFERAVHRSPSAIIFRRRHPKNPK